MLPNCDKSAAQKRGISSPASAAAENLDVQVADFLAQGIAVDAQQVRGADLVAAGGGQGRGQQWMFDLTQDPVIETGGRQAVFKARKIIGQVSFNRGAEIFIRARLFAARRQRRLG